MTDDWRGQDRRDITVQLTRLEAVSQKLEENDMRLERVIEKLVTMDRFRPVAYIAYGLAGGVLTSFLGAITALVFIR